MHATDDRERAARTRDAQEPALAGLPERIVFFDGVCGLCDRAVQFILAHDPAGHFHFAPLQGRTAAALRSRCPHFPDALETIVLLDLRGTTARLSMHSQAAFEIAADLDGPVRHARWLRALPRPLTDWIYRLVARWRYRVFGRRSACRVPAPQQRSRFLD